MTSDTRTGILVGTALVVVLFVALGIVNQNSSGSDSQVSDEFAQCITDSGAKMYGAYWCGHCNDQKEAFGSAWDKINYIECSANDDDGQAQQCTNAGITGYPTWEFGDGSRVGGKQTMEFLANKTGCEYSE